MKNYLATIIQLMQPAGMDCGKFYFSCAPTDSRTPRIQEGWRDNWRPDDGEFLNDNYCEYPVSDPRMTPRPAIRYRYPPNSGGGATHFWGGGPAWAPPPSLFLFRALLAFWADRASGP